MFSKSNIIKATLIGFSQVVVLVIIFCYCHSYIKQIIAENQTKKAAELSPVKNDVGLTKNRLAMQVKESKPEPVIVAGYI